MVAKPATAPLHDWKLTGRQKLTRVSAKLLSSLSAPSRETRKGGSPVGKNKVATEVGRALDLGPRRRLRPSQPWCCHFVKLCLPRLGRFAGFVRSKETAYR